MEVDKILEESSIKTIESKLGYYGLLRTTLWMNSPKIIFLVVSKKRCMLVKKDIFLRMNKLICIKYRITNFRYK